MKDAKKIELEKIELEDAVGLLIEKFHDKVGICVLSLEVSYVSYPDFSILPTSINVKAQVNI